MHDILFFLVPFLCIRVFFYKHVLRKKLLGAYFDVCAAAQLSWITALFPPLLPLWLTLSLSYFLLDALMQRKLHMRLHLASFHYIKEWKSLLASAKELGLFWFIAISLALPVLFFPFFSNYPLVFSKNMLIISSFVALLSSLSVIPLSFLKNFYETAPPLILEEGLLIRRFRLRKDISPSPWLPQGEESLYLHPAFPLYRCTKIFTEPSLFELPLQVEKKPHVILIVLESFRAKSITACNPSIDPTLTPFFNKLSKQGLLWKNCHSTSVRSCKALLALLFGVSSSTDGVIFKNNPQFPLWGLPELFHEEGYFNAFLAGGDLSFDRMHEWTKAHHFDLAEGSVEIGRKFGHVDKGCVWGIHDTFVMKRAVEVLQELDALKKPTFLTLSTISNHHPWHDPSSAQKESSYEKRFEKTLRYTDRCLEDFFAALGSCGLLEKSIFVITADHGQPFSEHGDLSLDRGTLYQESIWIPLLLLGKQIPSLIINDVASQIDLLPTLLDLLSLPLPHHAMGRSLLRKRENPTIFFHAPFLPERLGAREGRFKWLLNVETQEEELYDITQDPEERKNIFLERPKEAAYLREKALLDKQFTQAIFSDEKLFPYGATKKTNTTLHGEDLHKACKTPPHKILIENHPLVTDQALQSIAPYCKNLKELTIKNSWRVGKTGLETICKKAKGLSFLDISHSLQIDDLDLEALFPNLCHLHTFIGEGLFLSKERDDFSFFKKSPYLHTLSLLGVPLSSQALSSIMLSCPQLRRLKIDASHLDSTVLVYAPWLVNLHLTGCENLSCETLSMLKGSPNLSALVIENCPHLSRHHLANWKNLCLTALHLYGVSHLDDEALMLLLDHPLQQLTISGSRCITDEGVYKLSLLRARKIEILGCPNVSKWAILELQKTTGEVLWG